MIYYNLETLTDYFPPMLANFNATTYAAGPWNSVVFHCPAENERLALCVDSNGSWIKYF
jgi:hypothetical protein